MNKHLLDQLSAEEQPLAAQLQETAGKLQVSPAFEMELKKQLMDKYKTRTQPSGFNRFIPALGWAFAAVCAVFILNWTFRSLVPNLSAAQAETPTPQVTFEDQVHAGNICASPLAAGHNYGVALTNADQTAFSPLDEEEKIGELRSFAWSPDGSQLAVVGNTLGGGRIFFTASVDEPLHYTLSNPALNYLMEVAWSRDSQKLITWSVQNNTLVYVLDLTGNGITEIPLGMQLFGVPQFTPDGQSIVFTGADSSAWGLFEFKLDGSGTRLISSMVEHASAFTWSPDGNQLAYFLADRTLGEALLVAEDFSSGEKNVLATLPIPKGSGSSIPDIANLSWSASGKFLTFEFGRGVANRAIYLAYADGSGLVQLTDSGHAPAISADERCLAFISNKQVFLLDLSEVALDKTAPPPLLLAELPIGSSSADFRLDKLQWRP